MADRQPQGSQPPASLPARATPLWAGALGTAALQFLAFPPVGAPFLAHLALAPLFLAIFGVPVESRPSLRRIYWTAFLAQGLFYAGLLHWLLFLSKEEVTVPWIMVPALAVVCAGLAIFAAAAWAVPAWLDRRFGWNPLWTFPPAWVLFDWMRSHSAMGFSWGSLGYSLAPWPASLQMGSLIGYWGFLLWLVWTNVLIAFLIGRWARRSVAADAGTLGSRGPVYTHLLRYGPLVAIALPWILGALVMLRAPQSVEWLGTTHPAGLDAEGRLSIPTAPPEGPLAETPGDGSVGEADAGQGTALEPSRNDSRIRFALLQANTPREVKWSDGYREIVVDDLLDKTEDAVETFQPDLVVWPETAAPLRILWNRELADMVSDRIAATSTWVLVGTLDAKRLETAESESPRYEHYNAAVLFDPEGIPRRRYAKRHMVPFGEYTPYVSRIPWLREIDFGQSDFTPGNQDGLFEFSDASLAPELSRRVAAPPNSPREPLTRLDGQAAPPEIATSLICFEVAFPQISRHDVRDGARFLVTITNDFWFGASAGPAQHAQFPVLRAVETRTPMLRCANTGHSFVVDPYGRTLGWTPLFTPAIVGAAVEPNDGGSLYVRWGDLPALGLGFLFLVLGFRFRRRFPFLDASVPVH